MLILPHFTGLRIEFYGLKECTTLYCSIIANIIFNSSSLWSVLWLVGIGKKTNLTTAVCTKAKICLPINLLYSWLIYYFHKQICSFPWQPIRRIKQEQFILAQFTFSLGYIIQNMCGGEFGMSLPTQLFCSLNF